MTFLEMVAGQLNLRWAWEKVRHASIPGDVWFDEIELAGFELELERNLQSIGNEILTGRYRMSALRPLAFPKHPDEEGNERNRQSFHIAVRDQVAWTAVVNVVGPHVDVKMPPWSYGHRLFRSIWVETDEDGVRRRKIGRYRHSSGRIYLPFGQSWPIFRRHVFLATGAMTANAKSAGFDESTKEELELQSRLKQEQRCPFVVPDYWTPRRPVGRETELFWCSIDLEKFYPSTRLDVIRKNIVEQLPPDYQLGADKLFRSMFHFPLDLSGWDEESLIRIDIKPNAKFFFHLPTGLHVAGFLANADLLKVDLEVSKRLELLNVAHFRFVDDHVMLAYSFEELRAWVVEYMKLLAEAKTGAHVNPQKIVPSEFANIFKIKKSWSLEHIKQVTEHAKKACKLDPEFPSPLMTKTLALVSAIARTDFNLLEEAELLSLTDQLEHMLLVDISETEIPEKTRLAFAATRLTRLVQCRLANDGRLAEWSCAKQQIQNEIDGDTLSIEKRANLVNQLALISDELTLHRRKLDQEKSRAFALLRKVLREKPDRVRLWTRALQMCQQTGVKGLTDIMEDIRKVALKNKLAAEYLTANTLSMLGAEVMTAAKILTDLSSAGWRKRASLSFLEDVCSTRIDLAIDWQSRWTLNVSWRQYCFGVYCADLILKDKNSSYRGNDLVFPNDVITQGAACLVSNETGHDPAYWAWWAARTTLRDLSPNVNDWVGKLGNGLQPTTQTAAFWRFYPLDIPSGILEVFLNRPDYFSMMRNREGWWHDALKNRNPLISPLELQTPNRVIARVARNINH